MAYTVPQRINHGDFPTAANLNILGGDISYLYGLIEPVFNPVVMKLVQTDAKWQEVYRFTHLFRWLHYRTASGTTGTLGDPSGSNPDVTLPDTSGAWDVYDLSDVSWLSQGQVYTVSSVEYAAEDLTA